MAITNFSTANEKRPLGLVSFTNPALLVWHRRLRSLEYLHQCASHLRSRRYYIVNASSVVLAKEGEIAGKERPQAIKKYKLDVEKANSVGV